jgi:hypothetical protein
MFPDHVRRALLTPYQRSLKKRVGRGRDHWEMAVNVRGASLDDFVLKGLKKRKVRHLTPRFLVTVDVPVYARVSDNRWIADCECGGAEAVDEEDPRFFCLSCLNNAVGNNSRTVIFPDDMEEIDEVLVAREDPLTRGFTSAEAVMAKPRLSELGLVPESLETLEAENVVHGLPKRGE